MTGSPRLCVVMPAYNEAGGIADFINEIIDSLGPRSPAVIVVDDCSTDETVAEVLSLTAERPVTIVSMDRNVGHGPATVTGLRLAVDSGAEIILAVDGDGQFSGSDMERVVAELDSQRAPAPDVAEGARTNRPDPWFRHAVTIAVRTLVMARTRCRCLDANTPLRAYRRHALERLLPMIPEGSRVPNLWISMLVRRRGFRVSELRVEGMPRRSGPNVGTMWRSRSVRIPSRRFIAFCIASAAELLRPLPRD